MKRSGMSTEGLKVLRDQTKKRVDEGRVTYAERPNVETALREADERIRQSETRPETEG